MTRELFSADPRVGPADLARGSVCLQTYSCLAEGHSRDPRVRNYTILAASRLNASLVPIFRTPSTYHSAKHIYTRYYEATRHTFIGRTPCRMNSWYNCIHVHIYPVSQTKQATHYHMQGTTIKTILAEARF